MRWTSSTLTRAQAVRHVHPDAAFRRGRRKPLFLSADFWHWLGALLGLAACVGAGLWWGYW